MKRLLATAFACILSATPGCSGLYEGVAAYDRKDYATALSEFRSLAEQGNAKAQYNLGVMYEKGQGVPQDAAEAAKWYRRGAERGIFRAQSALGDIYEKGRGVPQDNVQAYKWYNLAAIQGVKQEVQTNRVNKQRARLAKRMTPAQLAEGQRLARLWKPQKQRKPKQHATTPPAPRAAVYDRKDDATALSEVRSLAEQGNAKAQFNLGVMYEQGRGVPQDYVQAHKWFNLAATQGEKAAHENRATVARQMTPADISKAQTLAREWWVAFKKRTGE